MIGRGGLVAGGQSRNTGATIGDGPLLVVTPARGGGTG